MSLTQDEKNEIRRENPTYPRVSRTTDPMVVRIDKTSLLVNDTMFTAKLKCGLGYKGYLIYSSGLGTPIYEKAAKTTGEWQKSFSTVGNRPYNIAFDSENTSQLTNVLTAAAKEWLDDLEIAIADRENDNAIKKAIDRLCWQLHYDITESHTNFPEVFKDNDFSDVEIDTGNGKTVNKSIEDNYTNISNSVSGGATMVCGGSSLDGVRSSISTFSTNLNTTFSTFDANLNGTLTSTTNTIKASINKVGENLKADSDQFTISKALREASDKSVSNQIKLQADEIKNGLGPNGSINTSLGAISDKVSIEGESGTVIGKLISLDNKLGQGPDGTSNNTVLYKLSELYSNTYNTKLNTDTIVDRIGSYGQDSIMHNLHDMNNTLTGLKADYSDSGKIIHTIRTWPVT